jgi:hypothetical protein
LACHPKLEMTFETWPSSAASQLTEGILRLRSRAKDGGERGIRTPGTVSGTVVFKTTAIDHSAISPRVDVLFDILRGFAMSSRILD